MNTLKQQWLVALHLLRRSDGPVEVDCALTSLSFFISDSYFHISFVFPKGFTGMSDNDNALLSKINYKHCDSTDWEKEKKAIYLKGSVRLWSYLSPSREHLHVQHTDTMSSYRPKTNAHIQYSVSFPPSLKHNYTVKLVSMSPSARSRGVTYLQCTDPLVIKHLNEQITSFPIWKFHYHFHNWIPNLISAPGLNSMWFWGECRCCQRSWTLV